MEVGEMERTTELIQPAQLPRPVKTKRETPPVARERRHKGHRSGKLHETPRRKDRVKRQKAVEEDNVAQDGKGASSSTVINVDSVRERTREENEEVLGLLESEWHDEALKPQTLGVCELLLTVVALATVIFFFPISLWFCVKIVREHERAVVFRLGHLLQGKPRGPGLLFYIPILDVCQKVDIRLKMLKVPLHMVVTKDLVCTEVSAVCYYRVENVCVCYSSVSGLSEALQALVQVSIREVIAQHSFTHVLQNRSTVAQEIQVVLDSIACSWGMKVERAQIEDVHLPPELQCNFAVEAEARRQAQIRVIAAEGERAACEALRASVDSLTGSPLAVQLRLLQLLHTLRSDQSAVLLNPPSDLLSQPLQLSTSPSSTYQNPSLGGTETAKDSPMM